MKISIIGAGNVGGLTAMRLAEAGIPEIVLVDVAKGLAQGKILDMDDAGSVLKHTYSLSGTDDIGAIKNSDIVIVTAGLARKPGMTREDLLKKNAQILKDVCLSVKETCPESIVIIVTNPLDLMAYLALKITGFEANRVFGMGVSLDAARFANQISKELKIPAAEVDAWVIGSHGEGMLPLPRFTTIKSTKTLDQVVDNEKVDFLVKKTFERGIEIVSLLGSGSAYFAPSQAISAIVKAIVKDEKRMIGVSALLNGEYGIKDVCVGVPCRIGRSGIEKIVEFDLNKEELSLLTKSSESISRNLDLIKPFLP